MKRGHTSCKCYVRRFDVPRGECVWITKDLIVEINPMDPTLIGYHLSLIDFAL